MGKLVKEILAFVFVMGAMIAWLTLQRVSLGVQAPVLVVAGFFGVMLIATRSDVEVHLGNLKIAEMNLESETKAYDRSSCDQQTKIAQLQRSEALKQAEADRIHSQMIQAQSECRTKDNLVNELKEKVRGRDETMREVYAQTRNLLIKIVHVSICMKAVRVNAKNGIVPPLTEGLVGEWRRAIMAEAFLTLIEMYGDQSLTTMKDSIVVSDLDRLYGRGFARDVLDQLARTHADEIDRRSKRGLAIAQLQSWCSRDSREDVGQQAIV